MSEKEVEESDAGKTRLKERWSVRETQREGGERETGEMLGETQEKEL